MGSLGDLYVELYIKGLSAFDSGMALATKRMAELATAGSRLGNMAGAVSKTAQLATALNTLATAARNVSSSMKVASRSATDGWAQAMRMATATTRAASSAITGLGRAAASLAQSGLRVLGTAATTAAQVNHAAMRIITDDLAAVAKAVRSVASILRNLPTLILPGLGHIVSAFRTTFATLGSIAKGAVSVITYPFRKALDLVGSLGGAIAALGVSLSVYGLSKWIIDVTSDAEQAKVAFTAMLHSEEKAVQMLKEIKKLADTTPLELPEVRQAARSLVAYGFAAEKTADTLRMLGDVSQGEQMKLQDLVSIYGKVFETGRITGVELLQFGRRHIRVVSELAAMYNTTPAAIRKMASEGKLGFNDLKTAFERLTAETGPFHNMLEKMGDTIHGRFSTLKDAVNAIAIELGQSLSPVLKKTVNIAIDLFNKAKVHLEVYRERIAEFANGVGARIEAMGVKLSNAFEVAVPYIAEFVKTAVGVKVAMSEITGEVVAMVTTWLGGQGAIGAGIMGLVRGVRFVAENWQLVGKLGMAYIHNWETDGLNFAKEFGKQLLSNLEVFASGMRDTFGTLFMLIAEGLKQAFRGVQADLPWPLNKAAKPVDMTVFNSLTDGLAINLKEMFTKLPGFDAGKMFKAPGETIELMTALKDLEMAKKRFDKDVLNEDLANAFFKAKREAEAAMGGQRGDDLHAGAGGAGGRGKGKGFEMMDPVAFYKKLQGGVSTEGRSTERFQNNLLKQVAGLRADIQGKPQAFGAGARLVA